MVYFLLNQEMRGRLNQVISMSRRGWFALYDPVSYGLFSGGIFNAAGFKAGGLEGDGDY